MEKNNQTYCAKCGLAFNCNSENIKECFCNSIIISHATLEYIKKNYTGCLCKNCLFEAGKLNSIIKNILLPLFIFITSYGFAQFHGAVGSPNTTAMYKDSSAFVNWASTCVVNRGWQNISDHSLGKTDAGMDEYGIGKAGDNPVVSLGDGGFAILTFPQPIINGTGYDFAVFENGFSDSFLELAFVEVSSDGNRFVRFPATSNTDYASQIGPFDLSGDASLLNNFAGKYRIYYGTPFDLNELKDSIGIDINFITHVKIIDVVGRITQPYASFDINHHPINDPYPTDFPNGGFDLDAVGVIHQKSVGLNKNELKNVIQVFPNPCNEYFKITFIENLNLVSLFNTNGEVIIENVRAADNFEFTSKTFPEGIYNLMIKTPSGILNKRLIVSH